MRNRNLIFLTSLIILAACSLPRGGALLEEIKTEFLSAESNFDFFPVTSKTLNNLPTVKTSKKNTDFIWPNKSEALNKVRAGDSYSIILWDTSSTSLFVRPEEKFTRLPLLKVDEKGRMSLPYAGEIKISGLTRLEAKNIIFEKIRTISPSLQVQIEYTPGNNNAVNIMGEIANSSQIKMQDESFSVLDAIAMSGGVKQHVVSPSIHLVREGKHFKTSLKSLLERKSSDIELSAGDTIFIEEDARKAQILGASGREEIITFGEEELSLLEALTMTGGLNDSRANPEGILLFREIETSSNENRQFVFSFDITSSDGIFSSKRFMVEDNDLIMVTESPVTTAQTLLALFRGGTGFVNSLQ